MNGSVQPQLVDSHCHLQASHFSADRSNVLRRCRERGMVCVLAGDSIADSKNAVILVQAADDLFCTVGVHPNELDRTVWDVEELAELLRERNVVGIGETGLDYYALQRDPESTKRRQWEAFRAHLSLAVRVNRPVVVHCRDAYEDAFSILQDFPTAHVMMHTFAGTVLQAERFIARGVVLSYSGVVTFPSAEEIRAAARATPLDLLVAETDAPFLTPVPLRGKRNEPVYVEYVIRALAALHQISWEALAEQVAQNAFRFFGITGNAEVRSAHVIR